MLKKIFALCLCFLLFAAAALAENVAETSWFELSDGNSVLTVRLPGEDGWTFEISDTKTMEFLTREGTNGTWVASFRATCEQFGNAEIDCTNASVGTYSIVLFVAEDGEIEIVSTATPADAGYVLAMGSVNIRKGAGTEYEILGTVEQDAQLTWKGTTAQDARGMIWFGVEYGGERGWVSARYSKLMDANLTVEFTGETVNVRNAAGLDGEIVDTFVKGDTALYLNVCELDERGVAWYNIRTDGGSCWVSSKYAKIK